MMDEKLQGIIDFFEQEEGWSKNELIADYVAEIEALKGFASDEIGLQWDDETLMILEDFADIFFDKIINGFCNVLKSYKESEVKNENKKA